MKGVFYGIGVGPGDPELLTLKAIKAIADCDILVVPDSGAQKQIALDITREHIGEKPVVILDLPMTCDKSMLQKKREVAVETISEKLDMGENVGFLTLGDPMVYSTYSYLHCMVISRGYTAKVIPGVTSFSAAAAALGEPLCEGGQSLHIIPAYYKNNESALALDGTKVFMKSGKKFNEMLDLLKDKKVNAKMAQRVGMDGERLYQSLNADAEPDYFSVIIVKSDSSSRELEVAE